MANVADTVALIQECKTLAELEPFKKDEERAGVLKALEKRAVELAEKPSAENEAGKDKAQDEENSSTSKNDSPLPGKIVFHRPYAFWDEDNELQQWYEGTVITDPDLIAMFHERGAHGHFKVVEDGTD